MLAHKAEVRAEAPLFIRRESHGAMGAHVIAVVHKVRPLHAPKLVERHFERLIGNHHIIGRERLGEDPRPVVRHRHGVQHQAHYEQIGSYALCLF